MITDVVFLNKVLEMLWIMVGINAAYGLLFMIAVLCRSKPDLLAGMGIVGIANFGMLVGTIYTICR